MNGGTKDPKVGLIIIVYRLINLLFSLHRKNKKSYENLLYNNLANESHRPDTIMRLEVL